MMSCGGTSRTTVCSETLIIVSNGQKMSTRPGPLGCADRRPSQKVTARSYSLRMLTHLKNRKIRDDDDGDESEPDGWHEASPLTVGQLTTMHGVPAVRRTARVRLRTADHLDRLPDGDRLVGHRVPDLAVDEDLAARVERRAARCRSRGSSPRLPVRTGRRWARRAMKTRKPTTRRVNADDHGDQLQADPQRRLRGLEQHQGADDQARSRPPTASMP